MISLLEFVTITGMATLSAAGVSHGLNLLRQKRGDNSRVPTRSSNHDVASGRPSAGAWHEPRYGKRHQVNCRMEYLAGHNRAEGILLDLSRQGWRARGTQPVAKGTALAVYIYFPDLAQPIMVDEAVVRWTDGLEFGVEVTRITPEAASKFSDYLSINHPAQKSTPEYALSHFSYS
ncbi:MAG TPA: PilZ domain-containing protein [Nitrospira sp.]|nr:PilZ domain-containing protein [Nitrospira sp.]